jgi:ribose transport system permease protein
VNNFSSIKDKSFLEILNRFKTGIGLLVLVIVLSFMSPYFLTIPNLLNIVRQVSIIAIIFRLALAIIILKWLYN